ncbi:MAG: hypothetical protein IPK13_02805 [Deltaproteobacteria bacterium]|nr:hypothetical protein [Deltaproteobacteria bacterium]
MKAFQLDATSERRGSASLVALMVCGAITALVLVGLNARSSEISQRWRGLCRLRSRWAAESAIARAEGRLPALARSLVRMEGVIDGSAPLSTSYSASVTRTKNGFAIEAQGICTHDARSVTSNIRVHLRRTSSGRWEKIEWVEAPESKAKDL